MTKDISLELSEYNNFCSNLKEGYVLYNVDTTNSWGDYLLVSNITTVKIADFKTYTVLLLGLKKEQKNFIPRNIRIKLTPEYANNVPFLKYVGYCNYKLVPELDSVNINLGLATVYSTADLHKFATSLSIRKPRKHKYGKDGKLIIRKVNNY